MTLRHPSESEVTYEPLIQPIVSTQSRQAARSGGKTREAGAGMGHGVPRSCGFDSRVSNSAEVFYAECPAEAAKTMSLINGGDIDLDRARAAETTCAGAAVHGSGFDSRTRLRGGSIAVVLARWNPAWRASLIRAVGRLSGRPVYQHGGTSMLVLSRKKNESVVIGDREVVITIVEIRGDKVKLGIEASPEIAVHRIEVYHAIKQELESGKDAP